MNSGWRWSPFMIVLFITCMVLAVVLYASEQQHLTDVRDRCIAESVTGEDVQECYRAYERNSGWF